MADVRSAALCTQVMQDSEVLELFDDKEVMTAVEEIGKHPAAMSKYANNARVQKLYRFMAAQAAEKLSCVRA
jgi:hypothetical protein